MRHGTEALRSADGLELYYQSWQPEGEAGAAIALVHGLADHSARYGRLVDELVPRGYAIHAIDLRGHGRSPGQRGYIASWSEYRGDVRALVERTAAESPGLPVFLWGHSLGGLIALEYALRSPDGLRGVVASAPALSSGGISPLKMLLGRVLSRVWPRFSMNAGLEAESISRDPAVVRAYREDPLVHGRGTARLATEANAAIAWVLAHAHEWKLPLLILHGGADRLLPVEGTRLFYERVTAADKSWLEYPEGYHECHNDLHCPQAMAEASAWLERHRAWRACVHEEHASNLC